MDIPGYKIVRKIAEGGMATVYEAIQESLGRKVALKLLKNIDNPELSERFLNEGKIIASLNHQNIITIHDIGKSNGQHYISMEYLDGGDLASRIATGNQPEDTLELIKNIGSCLDFVHKKDIIHRDIKPANILFRGDGTPVLTDFGIAKLLQSDSQLTLDGTAMGTPNYLSPEQAECKPVDGRTDIYSLGIIFYEMLTGEKPYQGDSSVKILMAHITAPIPELPSELIKYQQLLEKMIAKYPEDRFASAADMLDYIENLESTVSDTENDEDLEATSFNMQAVQVETPQSKETVKKPVNNMLIGGITLAIIAVVFVAFFLPSSTPSDSLQQPPDTNTGISDATPESSAEANNIRKLLADAQAAFEKDQLTTPENDNALFYFQSVLAINPENELALLGMDNIVKRYIELSKAHMDNKEFEKAKALINRALTISPDNPQLEELMLSLEKQINRSTKSSYDLIIEGTL